MSTPALTMITSRVSLWGHAARRLPPLPTPLHIQKIRHASRLVYHDYGPPAEVTVLEDYPDPSPADLGSNDILVEMKLATVSPADVNIIQGTYPLKTRPTLPAVGGGEGVGVVAGVGSAVVGLKEGDWVINSLNMAGTWNTHILGEARNFTKVIPS